MKNEIARREIESLDYYLQNHTNDYSEESHTAMMMAIKALEHEPCDDCVRRRAVMDCFKKCQPYMATRMFDFEKELFSLPSVNPQEPKTGHWRHYEGMLICSECGTEFYDDIMEYCGDDVPKCCPNCGAKMEGDKR